jgi:hypothetical protein
MHTYLTLPDIALFLMLSVAAGLGARGWLEALADALPNEEGE